MFKNDKRQIKNKKAKDESEKIISKLQKDVDEFKNNYLRVLADFRNFQNRIKDDIEREKIKTRKEVILKFLPFLDNLEKAEVFIKDDGLKLIKSDFLKALDELGVKEVEVEGKEFNPELCEAVDVVKGNKDNIVVKVVRKGYLLGSEVLRPARVIVSKKNKES